MNNYLYLVMLGFVLAFSSCSKDEKSEVEEPTPPTPPTLVTVQVETAGTLENVLSANYAEVKEVKIIGPLNGKDCAFISSQMTSLVQLDLSKATFLDDLLPIGAFQMREESLDSNKRYSTFSQVILPESLKTIDDYAFYQCAALQEISFPAGLIVIGESAFSFCTSLSQVILPSSVTDIRQSAFYHCTSLVDISLPEGLKTLSPFTFGECTKLVKIKIPMKVEILPADLFIKCTALKTVDLPAGLVEIYSDAFQHTGLESITLPAALTVINNRAFNGCASLTEVVCKAIIPPLVLADVFSDTPSAKTLKVPAASLEAYKAADAWKNDFTTIVVL